MITQLWSDDERLDGVWDDQCSYLRDLAALNDARFLAAVEAGEREALVEYNAAQADAWLESYRAEEQREYRPEEC